jgi:hypothetical protein
VWNLFPLGMGVAKFIKKIGENLKKERKIPVWMRKNSPKNPNLKNPRISS